jgi:mevalonate kinase
MTSRGTGLGKLILCGEHAVVYGYPALAMAVDRGTTVTIEETGRPLEIVGLDDPRLEAAVRTVVGDGVRVSIRSDLPIGRGMGSSAALAVALVRAAHGDVSAEECFERAFRVERVFHGNPSGVDHAVSARGGLVRYQRAPLILEDRPVPSWRLVVLDTGTAGDTAALVAGVASRRPAVDADLAAIGSLVDEVDRHLADGRAVGELLDENQRLLGRIGVSTPRIEDLCAVARKAGAYGAKLAGAGGGGVVVAIAPDPDAVVRAAAEHDIPAFEVGIGRTP